MDDPAASPLADRTAPQAERERQAIAESAPTWPVLARIAQIARSGEPEPPNHAPPLRAEYRVDAAHDSATAPAHKTAATPVKSVRHAPHPASTAADAGRDERVLRSVPLFIRATVGAWRIVEPYRELIRFAAMVLLMFAGGMSLMLLVAGGWQPAEAPPPPTTATTADHAATLEAEPPAAEMERPIDAELVPEAETTSQGPTAGPAAEESRPPIALETKQPAVEPDTEASAKPLADPVYPTTNYPAPTLPQVADDSLPQVQTTEPAVARLRGSVEPTQSR